ncbi:MAG TPA: hypothetical protein VJ673_15720 [Aromatoleum sp.]|uniref:pilus assembly PilX family protein n=1 Tax=Aromatoleum sp. TaxID=2307007 RepID=UPI002B4A8288|nr:hypothetical protein [Aromatoleum sp.]HJV27134.1 hypothetical protein [Aromatoleum sp.]
MEPLNRGLRAQTGVVLIVALIMLALLSLAALGVIRATDTGTLVAGNLAFRQATMHASEVAVDHGWEELASGSFASKAYYYAIRQTGSPDLSSTAAIATSAIWDGNAVPCIDERGANTNCGTDTGGVRIQYVIERQCESAPDLSSADSIKSVCDVDPATAANTTPDTLGIYYRVIIRARGPRGTLGFYEAMISGPAT